MIFGKEFMMKSITIERKKWIEESSVDPCIYTSQLLQLKYESFVKSLNKGIILNFLNYSDYFMLSSDMFAFIDSILKRNTGVEIEQDFYFIQNASTFLLSIAEFLISEAPKEEQNMFMMVMLIDSAIEKAETELSDTDRLFKLLEDKNPNHSALRRYGLYKAATNSAQRNSIMKFCRKKFSPLFGAYDYDIFSYVKNERELPKLISSFIDNTNTIDGANDKLIDFDRKFLSVCFEYMYSEVFPVERNSKKLSEIVNNIEILIRQLEDDTDKSFVANYNELISTILPPVSIDDIIVSVKSRVRFFIEFASDGSDNDDENYDNDDVESILENPFNDDIIATDNNSESIDCVKPDEISTPITDKYSSTVQVPVVELFDENGEKLLFELLDTIKYQSDSYVLLTPYFEEEDLDEDNPAADVFIMRELRGENDEPLLETVEDENLLADVYQIFKEKHGDEFNFKDN